MTKSELRAAIKSKIAAITQTVSQKSAAEVARRLAEFGWSGKRIMLYCALADELDVSQAAAKLGERNALFFPVVVGDDIMVAEDGAMSCGAFGIMQPSGERLAPEQAKIDVCIVPLRAFDAHCMRLGRGKGYYDRFFARCDCLKVGVAYDQQLADDIPAERHDVPLDMVVTPTRIYRK